MNFRFQNHQCPSNFFFTLIMSTSYIQSRGGGEGVPLIVTFFTKYPSYISSAFEIISFSCSFLFHRTILVLIFSLVIQAPPSNMQPYYKFAHPYGRNTSQILYYYSCLKCSYKNFCFSNIYLIIVWYQINRKSINIIPNWFDLIR